MSVFGIGKLPTTADVGDCQGLFGDIGSEIAQLNGHRLDSSLGLRARRGLDAWHPALATVRVQNLSASIDPAPNALRCKSSEPGGTRSDRSCGAVRIRCGSAPQVRRLHSKAPF